jgi:ribosomal protein S8
MAFLKDTEREKLRQLVKACLLEISKLKMELKKCQQESGNTEDFKDVEIRKKDEKINELINTIEKKDGELQRINDIFKVFTAKPKKDLTSFQSQIYQLLKTDQSPTEELYNFIKEIGFKELSYENFLNILRNLERKGYIKSFEKGKEIIWEKIEK